MRKLSKKKVAAAAGAVVLATSGGVAYAYWTTNGTGSGSATNASANGELVLHANFSGGLTPGASRDVTYTADNAGSSSLYVGSLSAVVSTDKDGCTADDFTVTANAPGTRVLANSSGTEVGTGTLTFVDRDVNQDACKGATVTISVTSV